MPNSQSTTSTRRQKWITAYRVVTVAGIAALVVIDLVLGVMVTVLVSRPASQAAPVQQITVAQASKIERATAFLQDVGFNDPIYLGITPGVEGEYPTFQVTAIGGKLINVWIRTTVNGGWEIQPVMLFESVASADDLARLAQRAVLDWEQIPSSIQPRTDGTVGEYESRKRDYELLAKYNPDASYWSNRSSETRDWPRK